jgi:formylglycine-generating enzyme required for sulfatase activity
MAPSWDLSNKLIHLSYTLIILTVLNSRATSQQRTLHVKKADNRTQTSLVLTAGNVPFEFTQIPAGEFLMGSEGGDNDEKPVHRVRIAESFYIGKTEVTVRQFRAFVEATGYQTEAEKGHWAANYIAGGFPIVPARDLHWRRPGFTQTDDYPVVCISFNDAIAFCRWLSNATRKYCRLPSEAEWEYACRAGEDDRRMESIGDVGWYRDNTTRRTQPVAQKKPNRWGLFDMHGNAWEWCLDVWHSHYRGTPNDGGAWLSEDYLPRVAVRRLLRGGAWNRRDFELSSTYRYRGTEDFRSDGTGFRIVHSNTTINEKPKVGQPVYERINKKRTPDEINRTDSDLKITLDGETFTFISIPPGEFMMGSEWESGEQPIHRVRIDYSFDIGKTEITVRQFRAFVEATGYQTDAEKERWAWSRKGELDWEPQELICWWNLPFTQTDDHPATCLSWFDAMAFCQWLSQQTGQHIRLPSASEWEYACRAGTMGDFAGDINEMAWHRTNSGHRTHPIGQKKPNPWGLYDMHGNVWEWCLDMWHESYEGSPADGSPWVEARTFEPIMRGGSFINPPWWLRSANHMRNNPGNRFSYNQGLRIVRSPAERLRK